MHSSSSGEKNRYCNICGKLIKDEPVIHIGEKEVCEECWLKYDKNEIEGDNDLDREIIYILSHKEEYTREKLMETLLYLRENGNEEALELEKYIKNYDSSIEEAGGILYSRGKAFKKSRGNVWIEYFKIVAYILWALITVISMILGSNLGHFYDSDTGSFIGGMLGGIVGFIIGFVVIAFVMLFVTMAENIATITDRTTEIVIRLEEK